jgi:hypothetical protein
MRRRIAELLTIIVLLKVDCNAKRDRNIVNSDPANRTWYQQYYADLLKDVPEERVVSTGTFGSARSYT